MNNCVGYLNYRYFVLFLMYMFIGCVYAVIITAPQFLAMAHNNSVRKQGKNPSSVAGHNPLCVQCLRLRERTFVGSGSMACSV